jgi:hypothetical protein
MAFRELYDVKEEYRYFGIARVWEFSRVQVGISIMSP